MSNLQDKSLYKLELPAVLQMLANLAGSPEGKSRCLELLPLKDVDDIRYQQRLTTDACKLISVKGSPGFSGVKDVSESLSRADRGGSLSAGELLEISAFLKCARNIKNYAETDSVESSLDPYFMEIIPNRYLEEKISNCIISEEEIADSASTELADIRRHIRIQSAKVRETLQKIISSPEYSKYLREPIITIRSDRFVVPVKSEYKSSVPGLVHDVSSTGSTFFVEPIQAVNANNAIKELLLREQKEIERILAELSAEAAAHKEHMIGNYEVLVQLDCVFAKAKLSFQMDATAPEINTVGKIVLKNARHPLIDKKLVVPICVSLGDEFDTLVITGPNTGGKTVTLKTIGLLTLMAACGMHIPADDGSCMSVFDNVLADIGDEQSIEQSLSTFSSHMKNIVDVIAVCSSRSLVLFDELGAGTDPTEGAALAIAIIEHCRAQGAKIAATTHYAELKLFAMRTDGVVNGSCEFKVETLKPTYRLLIGIPGKSNAFAISRRLGLPECIIHDASSLVNENDANFDDVLSQLEQQRAAMEQAHMEVEQLKEQISKNKRESDAYRAEIKKERDRIREQARKEAQHIIDDARRTATAVSEEIRQLRKQMKDTADAQGVNLKQAELRKALNEAEVRIGEQKSPAVRPESTREIRVGDTVELVKLGSKATVLAVNKDGTYALQAGILKINAKPDEVYLLEVENASVKKVIEKSKRELKLQVCSSELDIRGMASDEMLGVLSVFLDNAYMSNLPSVRIIHGKGTGVLRTAVHTELRRIKYVKRFRLGAYGEGEDGVTIVEFA